MRHKGIKAHVAFCFRCGAEIERKVVAKMRLLCARCCAKAVAALGQSEWEEWISNKPEYKKPFNPDGKTDART